MKPPFFFQIVGHLNGVELHGGVKVAKAQNQQEIDYGVKGPAGIEHPHQAAAKALGGGVPPRERADGSRQRGDGLGEDDGHDAGHVHLHGDVAGLAAVHLPTHHPFGVLHGQAPFGVGDEDDEDHDSQHTHHDEDRAPPGAENTLSPVMPLMSCW